MQATGRNVPQQSGELVLPLLAVAEYGRLERGTIQQHKLNAEYGFLHLNTVCYLVVPAKRDLTKAKQCTANIRALGGPDNADTNVNSKRSFSMS